MIQWAKFGSKVMKASKKMKKAVKKTGTYKDIRKMSKATPITFGQGALAFTAGAGAGALYKKSQGYEFKLKKSDPNYKALKKAGYI